MPTISPPKAMALFHKGPAQGISDTLSGLTVAGVILAFVVWRVRICFTKFCFNIADIIDQFLYALFLSPLRRIPGPLLAKVTGNWLLLIELSGNRAKTVHKLHQKYGPVVQI